MFVYRYFTLCLFQLLPNQDEDPREEEHGEAGYLNMENSSFLEYLDELCRDEEFVSKVNCPCMTLSLYLEQEDSITPINYVKCHIFVAVSNC